MREEVDVLVIGAGPAGTAAAVNLLKAGHTVLCVEKSYFPRYVIGESLLPRCNELLESVGMLEAVAAQGYMVKRGAVFARGQERDRFSFAEALDGDGASTWHVPRDHFDQVLATEARRAGVDLRFGHRVDSVAFDKDGADIMVADIEGETTYEVNARFVVDASGYGRVLPRLLDLELPADLPPRISAFTQVEGAPRTDGEEAGDIWICIHPRGGWSWIIPFSNGRTSVGLVCDPELWRSTPGNDREKLWTLLLEDEAASERLAGSVPVMPTRVIEGYSKKVSALHGDRWALVGNASDFLDPVFSSGISLALETAILAGGLVDRTLRGEAVDWDREYDEVVQGAVKVFLELIESWYRGELQTIFLTPAKPRRMRSQIASILGGHVLSQDNPFVTDTKARLAAVYNQVRARA